MVRKDFYLPVEMTIQLRRCKKALKKSEAMIVRELLEKGLSACIKRRYAKAAKEREG